MVFYFIGLGLGDETDITLKGLQAIRSCHRIYLEQYTAILTDVKVQQLQTLYQCTGDIIIADREMVEKRAEEILKDGVEKNIGFLVVGDPFCATTHHDLYLRARNMNINVIVIHNASIISAVGITGLTLYYFGQIVSMPFFRDNWRPDSFYDKIKLNRQQHCHTLILLDIKVKEQTPDNIAKSDSSRGYIY